MNVTVLKEPEPILFCDASSGIYIPQRFANEVKWSCVVGVSHFQFEILMDGPTNELYWEVWDEVLNNATVKDKKTGIVYTVYQREDLWLLPLDYAGPLLDD